MQLGKLDYTKHPLAGKIQRVSIMDYQPAGEPQPEPVPTYTETDFQSGLAPEPKPRPARKKSLYHSAKPPEDF